ncbi:hypothetical protein AVEN_29710-1 [Araneus ventricosus]|uniref:Uncharacterized protein n=1 Tax=Araneus ventricosus TaxID=182803 RepID=A0A4Y2WPL9_ARAVE|nr:hypothetical protein AVEN_29710-1 [Araneus ventricosus]
MFLQSSRPFLPQGLPLGWFSSTSSILSHPGISASNKNDLSDLVGCDIKRISRVVKSSSTCQRSKIHRYTKSTCWYICITLMPDFLIYSYWTHSLSLSPSNGHILLFDNYSILRDGSHPYSRHDC